MKQLFAIIAAVILVSLVFAQDQPVAPAFNAVPTTAVHSPAPVSTSSQKDWPDMVEVFGGYSYVNVDMNNLVSRQSANGWETAVSSRLYQRLSVEGDVSGFYKGVSESSTVNGVTMSAHLSVRDYAFVGGPRVNLFKGFFVHALFGADRLSGDLSLTSGLGSASVPLGSQTSFVFAPGGGVQIKATRNLSIRTTVDYVMTRHDVIDALLGFPTQSVHQNNFRVSVGPVFRFGGTAGRAAAFPTSKSRPTMVIPALGVLVSTRERNDGADIIEVAPGGVAELSGLRITDVINAIDGKPINTPMELAAELLNRASGSKIRLGYMFRSAVTYYSKETVVILGQTR